MKTGKPTVLFFPYHPTSWPSMFKLAIEFKKGGVYEPVMFITESIRGREKNCLEREIECHFLNSDFILSQPVVDSNVVKQSHAKSSITHFVKNIAYVFLRKIYRLMYSFAIFLERKTNNRIHGLSFHQLVRAVFELAYYKNGKKLANEILNRYQPKAIFMYIDNAGGAFGCISKECQKKGIKIIIPVVAFQHSDIIAARRSKVSYIQLKGAGAPWINRFLKRIVPDQFYKYQDKEIMFYLPYETLAMYWAKILPPYPWIRGKNRCDVICVEDFYQKSKLEELGVDSKRIVVAGHVDFDDLWNAKNHLTREEFFKQYGFDESKRLVILAIPQLFYEGVAKTREEHDREIEFLIQTIEKTGQNILLTLHPKMDSRHYRYLEDKFKCRINTGKTSDVIPFGDIYISAASSTNFWAISCGLIVINIANLYGYSSSLFSYLNSIISVKSKSEFIEAVSKIVESENFYHEKQKQVQKNQSEYFLPLDGKNTQRYLSLVEENTEELLLT